jgi:hypothetical protein
MPDPPYYPLGLQQPDLDLDSFSALDRHEALQAVASLAEVATEQQLEDTLAACRLHR